MKKSLLLGMFTLSALLPAQAALYSIGNVNDSGTSLTRIKNGQMMRSVTV